MAETKADDSDDGLAAPIGVGDAAVTGCSLPVTGSSVTAAGGGVSAAPGAGVGVGAGVWPGGKGVVGAAPGPT